MHHSYCVQPITHYQDYRNFLNDFVQERRAASSSWSLSVWRRQLNINSSGTLSMVLAGKRHPGKKLKSALAHYFKFTDREAKYFSQLIGLQRQFESSHLRLFMNQDCQSAKGKTPRRVEGAELQAIQEHLLTKLTHVIRELTSLQGFRADPQWISARLRDQTSPEQISSLLDKLMSLKLLERSENSGIKASSFDFQMPRPDVGELATFHQQILEGTLESLHTTKEEERAFHVSFLNIRKNHLELAKKMIRQFQIEFSEVISEVPGDEIYQLSVQFVPMTKPFHENST